MDLFRPENPALTASEDKALKREAIRKHGKPDTPRLEQWLAHYKTPRRAELYARVAARQKQRHGVDLVSRESLTPRPNQPSKRRAELYARVAARKKRIDDLLELRARAIANSLRRPIPPPCHPAVERLRVARHNAQEMVQQEAERAAEREAATARVKYVVELRAAGKENRRQNS
ncbi:hypothetical protein C8F04DRAFT_1276135 [Mycena alexandri]|uniref:Uncharacterized protein n=1 Tax=Mycena alexandri TaxID=1745969 RepID=A0AAD6WNS3_9AGAR|nr:hypothetical protein C8F04DRAFT_1276135 [Mycena alexandri]